MNYYGTSFWAPTNNHQNEFYHFGILGMRWGIRRYQNYDGSLTTAGKKHYGREDRRAQKKEANKWRKINKLSSEERKKVLEENNKAYFQSIKDNKKKYLENAKEHDQYMLDYLEMVPDELLSKGGKDLLQDYEKYLTDPEHYRAR